MFTGLIQRVGKVRRVSHGRGICLEIEFEPWQEPLVKGESIAVNGVCLSVVNFDATRFTADILQETLSRSTLGSLIPGERVNLERALKSGQPFGGHIVQGHVDSKGEIVAKTPKGRDFQLKMRCSRTLAAASVLKGSIAVDGVSLTISLLGEDFIAVDIIPTTAAETTLGQKKIGDKVNLEGDILGKYIAKSAPAASGLTEAALRDAGFWG